jgi:hypothetical protein
MARTGTIANGGIERAECIENRFVFLQYTHLTPYAANAFVKVNAKVDVDFQADAGIYGGERPAVHTIAVGLQVGNDHVAVEHVTVTIGKQLFVFLIEQAAGLRAAFDLIHESFNHSESFAGNWAGH